MIQTITGTFNAEELHGSGQYFNPCQLRPYKPHGCPRPLTPHHCIPDHCWKDGDGDRITIKSAQNTTMSKEAGLCICVSGTGKSDSGVAESSFDKKRGETMADMWKNRADRNLVDNFKTATADIETQSIALANHFSTLPPGRNTFYKKADYGFNSSTKTWNVAGGKKGTRADYFDKLGSHGKIHHVFDESEDSLASANQRRFGKKHRATLGQLETLAAQTINVVTGCDPKDIQEQLRTYHEARGITSNTVLRAKATQGGTAKDKDFGGEWGGPQPAPSLSWTPP